jgi:hypothetical protein
MFGQHLAALAAQVLTSWIWFDWPLYWALFTALRNLAAIRQKRHETRRTAARSDRELLRLLDRFYRTAPIRIL